jgi:mannose-6-phosphate isomerase-like protein (cupin superfamily)
MQNKIWLPAMIALALAAAPNGNNHWTDAQVQEISKTLPAKMTRMKVGTQSLANWGNHSLTLAHREGNGEAELHETQNDIIFIRGGEATFVLGGKIPDGRPTAANEVRGSKIEGGERFPVHAGDVIHVPLKTPHQFLVDAGHKVDYFAVKVDKPAGRVSVP